MSYSACQRGPSISHCWRLLVRSPCIVLRCQATKAAEAVAAAAAAAHFVPEEEEDEEEAAPGIDGKTGSAEPASSPAAEAPESAPPADNTRQPETSVSGLEVGVFWFSRMPAVDKIVRLVARFGQAGIGWVCALVSTLSLERGVT
jgi:hypothetical protein